MEKNNSNILIKTIIFIALIAISCLVFFGLGKENKVDTEIVSFGFIMFSALAAYLSIIIPSIMNLKKLSTSDISACGVLYLLSSIVANCIFIHNLTKMKTLVIINIIIFIVFLIIFCSIMLRKKK